jgi:ADP-ribosylglycohydrolase
MAETPGRQSRFRGTLIGCAVGDALGAGVEARPPEVCEAYVAASGLRAFPDLVTYPIGQVTDDTQMTLALAEAIVEAGGRVDGEVVGRHFVALWRSGVVGRGSACNAAVRRLIAGRPWSEAGCEPGRAGNGTAMRASPVGLLHAGDLDALIEGSRVQSIVTHTDLRAVEGAALVAAAVAWNLGSSGALDLGAFARHLLRISERAGGFFAPFLHRLPAWVEAPGPATLAEIARAGLAAGPGEESAGPGSGITPYVVPTALWALVSFARFPDDFLGAVGAAISGGGDADTTAAIAGAIAGARVGIEGIPADLARGVLFRDRLIAAADALHSLTGARG